MLIKGVAPISSPISKQWHTIYNSVMDIWSFDDYMWKAAKEHK